MNTWTDRYRFIKIPPHCEGLEKSAHGQIISRVLFPLVIKGVHEMGFRSFAPPDRLRVVSLEQRHSVTEKVGYFSCKCDVLLLFIDVARPSAKSSLPLSTSSTSIVANSLPALVDTA